MAISDSVQIQKFLTRWCAVPAQVVGAEPVEEKPPHYARVRAGRVKSSAETVWRRDTTGADPKVLANEIMDRHAKIDRGFRGWLEVLERGGTGTVDALPLGEPADGEGEAPTGLDSMGMSEANPTLISALVAMSGQTMSAWSAERGRNQELTLKLVEQVAISERSAAMIDFQNQLADQGGMSGFLGGLATDEVKAAMKEHAPTIAAAFAGMAANYVAQQQQQQQRPQPQQQPSEVTPGDAADRILNAAENLWKDHPEAFLDPGRLLRFKALGDAVMERVMGGPATA